MGENSLTTIIKAILGSLSCVSAVLQYSEPTVIELLGFSEDTFSCMLLIVVLHCCLGTRVWDDSNLGVDI